MKKRFTVFIALLLCVVISMSVAAATPDGVAAQSDGRTNKVVKLYPFTGRNGKWGYMNEKGKIIINSKYRYAKKFSNGLANVGLSSKARFINENDEIVITIDKGSVSSFENGNAAVRILDDPFSSHSKGTTQWIDTTGKIFLETRNYNGRPFGKEGLADVLPMSPYWEGPGHVFINKKGERVLDAGFYSFAHSFSEGMAAVETGSPIGVEPNSNNGKWGYIGLTGKTVIEPQYSYAGDFSQGLAPVCIGYEHNISPGNWGFIDKTGKVVIPMEYEGAFPFHEGIAAVKKNGKWGFIDITGKVVIEPQYPAVSSSHNGLIAITDAESVYGERDEYTYVMERIDYYIDHNNNKIVPRI